MTEITASTGAFAKNLIGGSYGFNDPSAVAFDGTRVWVINAASNSVTPIRAA